MGGHAAGEVASARATEVVKQHITANKHLLKDLAHQPHARTTARRRRRWWRWPSSAPARTSTAWPRTDATKRGMGTTFVCLARRRQQGRHRPRGRLRVYLVRNGQCHRLTEDHTLVAAQLKAGTITKEQAATSQYRNVITRAVGIQESVQVDTLIVDLLPGDVFLLCSDGLHGYLAGRGGAAAGRRRSQPEDLPQASSSRWPTSAAARTTSPRWW